jgi:Na+/H+ antiporter NhaD/arsenite permease-like protein
MMVIANTLRRTGVFQWAAMKIIDVARGEPVRVLLLLSTMTALTSAFLDNVTTVVLMVPITIFVAGAMGVTPVPYLISEVLASNIGGAATLIGDPPNIIIGSAAGLDFGAFLLNMAPVILIIYALFTGLIVVLFRRQLRTTPELQEAAVAMDEEGVLADRKLLVQSLVVLGAVIVGFLLHGALHYEAATVAMTGAAVLMLVSSVEVHDIVSEIEWATLLFFFGLFIVVEALVQVGFVEVAARGMLSLTGGDAAATTMLILWGSAVASAIIDNIPYTATMVTIVPELARTMPAEPLWWALALGACLGGNGTAIGASANVIVLSLAERAGYKITFMRFLGYGVLVTLMSVLVSTVYVWARYLG